ncbi:pirin-like C-terminal cupin domain-containing protein [Flavitalea flava]
MHKRIEHILSGLLHNEEPPAEWLKNAGVQELIRLWINVPAPCNGEDPSLQPATFTERPQVLEQEGVDLCLSSGTFENKTGPLKCFNPVISISGVVQKGKRVQFSATPGYRALLCLIKGVINVNCETVGQYHVIVFEKENDEIIITAEEETELLFLSVEPTLIPYP